MIRRQKGGRDGEREQGVKNGGGGEWRSGALGLFSKHLANVHGSSQGPPAIREEICIVNEASKTQG